MSRWSLAACAVVAAGTLVLIAKADEKQTAAPKPNAAEKKAPPPRADRVARGKYLSVVAGCRDCHSPKKVQNGQPLIVDGNPVEDESRTLSGSTGADRLPPPPPGSGPWIAVATWDLTAWSGPWGISYAINLTPDEGTGIGSWSEDTFVKALKTGKHMGVSRPILPPMPWQDFRQMTDEDLKSIYAYLRTIPPVTNRVPDPKPASAPK
jgi:mono/diheme cytochrome c family protein